MPLLGTLTGSIDFPDSLPVVLNAIQHSAQIGTTHFLLRLLRVLAISSRNDMAIL
jgi:hypothetical protein